MKKNKARQGIIKAFNAAIEGIIYTFKSERNMKIHYCLAVLVFVASLFFGLRKVEMILLVFAISLVIIAEMFNTDIYILPSSIHEVIVVSSIIKSAEDLALMVKDINRTELKPEEILSDHVYFYGKEEKIFKIAA